MEVLVWFLTFIFLNLILIFSVRKLPESRLKICAYGCRMLICFLITCLAEVIYLLVNIPMLFNGEIKEWLLSLLFVVVTECVVFWFGIIPVYISSKQLGMKWRVIGLICGWIPVANLIVLFNIIRIASAEYKFESYRIKLNNERKSRQICKTKYPILMVHGVFFRDFEYFNYWGRIPKDLEDNGATIFYGNHHSAASVADCGVELSERIKEIVESTGCEKVNIIAHSKGGLDSRYAISKCGMEKYVASLTTINTPHRGCEFADYLLNKMPQGLKDGVAATYNATLHKLGDENPDFIAAVTDLTASACEKFNDEIFDSQEVYYKSIGSKMNVASSGRFPLNFSHHLVKYFDGANDGLVGEKSFPWGKDYTFLNIAGVRGISHGDMIDLNRENIKGFDVREFYVNLVSQLRENGF